MLKVFVSSTFKDFQTERDYIRNVVQPELSDFLKKYGISFSFTDLRWGINTEEADEENEKKVLSVCINEIKRARPYTIVLLGERYGYIPDEKFIRYETEKNKIILEDEKISATQLEIEFAAFQKMASNNQVFFYIREMDCSENAVFSSESPELLEKQNALKKRIYGLYGDRVRSYKANLVDGKPDKTYIEMLGKDIIYDLKKAIIKELDFSKDVHAFEHDNSNQWNLLNDKKEHFLARKKLAEDLAEKIKKPEARVALVGKTGLGKSTLFAEVLNSCKENFDLVLPFFCASSIHTSTEKDILGELVYLLEKYFEEKHIEESFETKDFIEKKFQKEDRVKKLRYRLVEMLEKAYCRKKRILIAVDALDQLSDFDTKNNFLLLSDKSPSVCLFVTGTEEASIAEHFEKILLSPLSEQEKRDVANRLLYISGKELSEKTLECLFEKKNTENPLYLYLLVQRLLLLQSKDYMKIYLSENTAGSTQERLRELIREAPDDIEEMAFLLIEVIEKISSVSILPLAEAIAISRFGLRQSDLEKLYKNKGMTLRTLDLVLFVNYIDEVCFYRSDGQIDFMHKCVRNAVLKHIDDPFSVHNNIIHALKENPEDDPVKLEEFQYHLIKAKKKKMFVEYIGNLSRSNNAERIIISNAVNLLKLALKMGKDGVEALLSDFDNWNDCQSYYNETENKTSLVAFEDFAAFLFYLSVQLKHVTDETRNELEVYMKFCNYCIEKLESAYNLDKNSQEIVMLYSDCLSCLHDVYSSLGMYERAALEADKAYDLWDEAISLGQTENNTIKLIYKLIDTIISKQKTEDKKLHEEAIESIEAIRYMMASIIEEKPILIYVKIFLLTFFLEGITLYNMSPQENRGKAISSFKEGLDFIRDYDRDIIDEHLSTAERMFVTELLKLGETDPLIDALELAEEELEKTEKEFILSPSTTSEIALLNALENIIVFLKDSTSLERLNEALFYAKRAVEHAESVNKKQESEKSIYDLSRMFVYRGEIYLKIHEITDDNISDGLAFNNLMFARNYIDKLKSDNNALFCQFRFDINEKIFIVLFKMPEQRRLARTFLVETMSIAEEMFNKFSSAESTYVYSRARLNMVAYNISSGIKKAMTDSLEILEEVEGLISEYTGKENAESFDFLMDKIQYYRDLILNE